MKTFFSEFQFCQERHKGLDPKSYKDVLNHGLSFAENNWPAGTLDSGEGRAQLELMACAQFGEMRMLAGRGIDYFVETEILADLISGMVKKFTPDVLDVFSEHRDEVFVIHAPSPRQAILCVIATEDSGTRVYMAQGKTHDYKNRMTSRTCLIGNKSFVENLEREPRNEYERLVVGLALYMRFFPSAVREGIPDFAKHPNHYKGRKSASIKLTEELVSHSGPKPHIRRAHFRFCSAPVFKASLNKYVLVRESFVKGRCRIVVEAEDLGQNSVLSDIPAKTEFANDATP